MRSVLGLVLLMGLALAGFAVYMVRGFVTETEAVMAVERQKAAGAVETVDIYAVNREFRYGEKITENDLELIKYAKDYLLEGTFSDLAELFPDGKPQFRGVIRPLEPNEPVLAVKIGDAGVAIGITSLLTPGLRAFTIEVDVTTGVSGFLRPGDRVDVFWTGKVKEGDVTREVTQRIKTNVQLIATDQTEDTNRSGAAIARTVTVEATPEDVAALAQAQASGDLSLALVGTRDVATESAFIQVDQNSVLGIKSDGVKGNRKTCIIKNRRGAEIFETVIPC